MAFLLHFVIELNGILSCLMLTIDAFLMGFVMEVIGSFISLVMLFFNVFDATLMFVLDFFTGVMVLMQLVHMGILRLLFFRVFLPMAMALFVQMLYAFHFVLLI